MVGGWPLGGDGREAGIGGLDGLGLEAWLDAKLVKVEVSESGVLPPDSIRVVFRSAESPAAGSVSVSSSTSISMSYLH